MLSKLTAAEVNDILDETVQALAKKGFICGSKFILDATDIETTTRCEGRGVKKVKKCYSIPHYPYSHYVFTQRLFSN